MDHHTASALFIAACILSYVSCSSLRPATTGRGSIVIGLNPALQRAITVPNLHVGGVNRGSQVTVGVGGKGQNVIVASSCLPSKDKPQTLLQFLGKGFEGDAIEQMLQTKTQSVISVQTKAPCRVCITILDGDVSTEIIEPSDGVSESEVNDLLSAVSISYSTAKAKNICIMGSVPKNCPATVYSDIIQRIADSDTQILFDTVVGIVDAVGSALSNGCSCIVKINVKEILALNQSNLKVSDVTNDIISSMASNLSSKLLLKSKRQDQSQLYIALTDGPNPSHLLSISLPSCSVLGHYNIVVPPLDKPLVSPIGAGDATSAGTFSRLVESRALKHMNIEDILDAFRFGLSCGSASCLNAKNSQFEMIDVDRIFGKMKIVKIR